MKKTLALTLITAMLATAAPAHAATGRQDEDGYCQVTVAAEDLNDATTKYQKYLDEAGAEWDFVYEAGSQGFRNIADVTLAFLSEEAKLELTPENSAYKNHRELRLAWESELSYIREHNEVFREEFFGFGLTPYAAASLLDAAVHRNTIYDDVREVFFADQDAPVQRVILHWDKGTSPEDQALLMWGNYGLPIDDEFPELVESAGENYIKQLWETILMTGIHDCVESENAWQDTSWLENEVERLQKWVDWATKERDELAAKDSKDYAERTAVIEEVEHEINVYRRHVDVGSVPRSWGFVYTGLEPTNTNPAAKDVPAFTKPDHDPLEDATDSSANTSLAIAAGVIAAIAALAGLVGALWPQLHGLLKNLGR